MKTAIPVTAIWLRRIGSKVQVLAEIEKRGWCLVIEEHAVGAFSHIAEGTGAENWPEHAVTNSGQEPR